MGARGCELQGVAQKETPDECSSCTTRAGSEQVMWPICPTCIHLPSQLSLPLPTPTPAYPSPTSTPIQTSYLTKSCSSLLVDIHYFLDATPATAFIPIPLSIGRLSRRSEHTRHQYIASASSSHLQQFSSIPPPPFSTILFRYCHTSIHNAVYMQLEFTAVCACNRIGGCESRSEDEDRLAECITVTRSPNALHTFMC